MRCCGTCRFCFDDKDIGGKVSEYGDCEGPIPISVHSPILRKVQRVNDGKDCQVWQETLNINAAFIRSHLGEHITIKRAFDVISFQSLMSIAEIMEKLQTVEDDLGKIGRIGLSIEIGAVNDGLIKAAFDIKSKINPSVFKK